MWHVINFFFCSRMAFNNTSILLTDPDVSSTNDKTTVDIDAIMENITIVFYTITVLLGTTGNAVVIWMSGFRLKANATNVWLVNLAVADLIFCLTRFISLIKKLFYDYWPFGIFLCKFNGFFKYTNMFCSVFILAVISLDRALCVWRPVFIRQRRTLRAARVISVGVWTVAVIFSVPYFVYRKIHIGKNNLSKCSMEVKNKKKKSCLVLLFTDKQTVYSEGRMLVFNYSFFYTCSVGYNSSVLEG